MTEVAQVLGYQAIRLLRGSNAPAVDVIVDSRTGQVSRFRFIADSNQDLAISTIVVHWTRSAVVRRELDLIIPSGSKDPLVISSRDAPRALA